MPVLANLLRCRSSGNLLFLFAGLLFCFFATICFTDLNHPPGVRYVRIASLCAVVFISLIEYKFAFCGLSLFALLFSQYLPFKVAFVEKWTAHASFLPDITSWACAAGMAATIAMRQWRTVPPDPIPEDRNAINPAYRLLPIAFVVLMAITILSAGVSILRLNAAPKSWEVIEAYFRGFLSIHPLSVLRPFWNALPIIANGVLALAVLRSILYEEKTAPRIRWVLAAFVAAMLIGVGQFVWQMEAQWIWNYQESPAGPFANRNLAAPLMIMAAVFLCWFWKESKGWLWRLLFVLLALVLIWSAIRMGSRASIIILAGLGWGVALAGARRFRAFWVGLVLPILGIAALYWVPLPDSSKLQNETARRTVEAVNNVRAGDWTKASTYRNELWYGAGRIWLKYPVLGSGPGTYYLYTNYVPETKLEVVKTFGVASFSAHSSPINLLAECGPLASLSWIYIFLVAPLYVLITARKHAMLSVTLFAFGIVNLMDTAWYSDGAMTMASIWIAAAIYEQKKVLAADSVA